MATRPNHELTDEERREKHDLKRLLKRQMKRRKYETRLHQAILRNDLVTEERSRKELERFLQQEEHEVLKTQSLGLVLVSSSSSSSSSSPSTTSSSTSEVSRILVNDNAIDTKEQEDYNQLLVEHKTLQCNTNKVCKRKPKPDVK